MILYTIYDPNLIFKNGSLEDAQPGTSYTEMNIDGIRLQVSQNNNADLCVERIISTNPADFLNPKLQPGCFIKR